MALTPHEQDALQLEDDAAALAHVLDHHLTYCNHCRHGAIALILKSPTERLSEIRHIVLQHHTRHLARGAALRATAHKE